MFKRYSKLLEKCKKEYSKKVAGEYTSNVRKETSLPFLLNEKSSDNYYKELLEKIGLSKQKFVKLANQYSYENYDNEKRQILASVYSQLVAIIEETKGKGEVLTELKNFFGYIDDIYSQQKYRKFLYHTRKGIFDFKNLPDLTKEYPIEECFDKLEDCFLGFIDSDNEFSNIYIRVNKTEYTMLNKEIGENKNTLVFSIFRATQNLQDSLVAEFSVFENNKEDIYIRFDKKICSLNCPFINNQTFYAYETKEGTKAEFCKVTKDGLERENCSYCFFEPKKIIALCSYVWDIYHNRRTINKAHSKVRELFEKHPVSIQQRKINNNDDNALDTQNYEADYKIIKLNELYKYERERKEWQGRHHCSPVEHERCEHTRTYRNPDGTVKKVVKVKSSIINRGGKRAVYLAK